MEAYRISVEAGFSAVHQVRFSDGTLEPLHGHDWLVRAHFGRRALDDAGMVVDFLEAGDRLRSVLAPLQHANLNSQDWTHGLNPTAEVVAKHIFDQMRARGLSTLFRIEVVEAPGCEASYETLLSS